MSDDLRFTSTVVGDVELKRRFQDFNSDVRQRMRQALADIGAALRDRIAAEAPRKTGALAGSVREALTETGDRLTETVRPNQFYARFMEYGVVSYGTRKNKRTIFRRLALSKTKRQSLVDRVRELRAGGQYRVRPRPFIGPAWEAMREPAQAEIAAALAEAVKGS